MEPTQRVPAVDRSVLEAILEASFDRVASNAIGEGMQITVTD
ncbi:hypothetical protein [Microbacterium ulmi]|nr:hypothetical protein [Microbacterium ulmi]NII69152.1 hypothetical protein [Microbacterium ulmi]